jgi:hypothetical protein
MIIKHFNFFTIGVYQSFHKCVTMENIVSQLNLLHPFHTLISLKIRSDITIVSKPHRQKPSKFDYVDKMQSYWRLKQVVLIATTMF